MCTGLVSGIATAFGYIFKPMNRFVKEEKPLCWCPILFLLIPLCWSTSNKTADIPDVVDSGFSMETNRPHVSIHVQTETTFRHIYNNITHKTDISWNSSTFSWTKPSVWNTLKGRCPFYLNCLSALYIISVRQLQMIGELKLKKQHTDIHTNTQKPDLTDQIGALWCAGVSENDTV